MIPNNNLSVLPWYTSIDQQNARKWWVYGREYPLFTPAGFLLPFQVLRTPSRIAVYEKGTALDIVDSYPGWQMNIDDGELVLSSPQIADCSLMQYDCLGLDKIYLENIPLGVPRDGYVTCNIVFAEENTHVLAYRNEHYTGVIDVPEGASSVWIQVINSEDPVGSGSGYEAIQTGSVATPIASIEIYTRKNELVGEFINAISPGITIKVLADYDCIVYPAKLPFVSSFANGQYYAKMTDGTNVWYSEVFTVVNDIEAYLKLEWWDEEDFVMDAGTIVYTAPAFKNVLYLQADIAKPEYVFEEEGETRDGYYFPTKQISEKRYRFAFFASEYLLDVMRFVRMSDFAQITKNGQVYTLDTFLMTPEWEDNGDVASVEAEFDTATVAKKIGVGYIKAQRGDFNDDFNKDYNT